MCPSTDASTDANLEGVTSDYVTYEDGGGWTSH